MSFTEIKGAIDQMAEAQQLFQASQIKRFDEFKAANDDLRDRIETLEAIKSSPGRAGDRGRSPEVKGFLDFVRTGNRDNVAPLESKEMSIGGGAAAGGAMVPEFIANQIINRALARSPLVGLVRNMPASTSDYVRLVNLRGAAANWSSETGTRSDTATPQLREVRPTHGELYSYPAVTNWLLQDAKFNVEDFLLTNVSDEFAKSLEAAVLNGDGSNKPTGIFDTTPVTTGDDASPVRDADAIQYVSGTADLADDIVELYFTLKPEYRRNAVFVMSSATLAAVRKLRDSNGGGFLFQVNLAAGVDAADGFLLGKRVATSEEMPTVGASPSEFSILCGDFVAGYELVRIGGMGIIRDEITTPGKTKLYVAQRFGGRLVDNDALKVLDA